MNLEPIVNKIKDISNLIICCIGLVVVVFIIGPMISKAATQQVNYPVGTGRSCRRESSGNGWIILLLLVIVLLLVMH